MMAGEFSLACSNRSRTREAPTPTNISTNSEPDMEKKGTPASPATALASRVFPVPGGPYSRTPLGILAPTAWNFSGSERNSRISSSSSTASSSPATSSKVTSGISLEPTFALDRPKPMAPPRPPLIRPSNHHMIPRKTAIGSSSWSMEDHQLVVGTTESKPPDGSAAWTRSST